MSTAPSPLKTGFVKQNTEILLEARNRLNEVLDMRARQWSLFEDASTRNTAVQICTEQPSVCSPSTLNLFLDCSARWWYKKGLGLPDKRTLALGLGSAVHEAVGANYRQKLETHEDLPIEAVRTVFADSFEQQLDECTLEADDDIADAKNAGDVMLAVYMDNVAPGITPAAVEKPVSGRIGDVPVSGFIDLLTTDGTIIDLKTAKKKPGAWPANHRRQVTTYAMLEPKASGRVRLDTLTKTKTVALDTRTLEVGAEDRRHVTRLYSIALEQMKTGLVMPNRSSFLCSKKCCAYHEICCSDFGGTVE